MQWFVAEGDAVEAFGRVCEVQSDKATLEITSPFAGSQPRGVAQLGQQRSRCGSTGPAPIVGQSTSPASHSLSV